MSIKIPRDHRIRWHSNYAFKMCLFFGLMKMYCVIWRHLTTLHVNLDWYATFTLCWPSTIMPTCYSVVSLRVGRFKYRLWQILTILLIHCFIYFKSDGENAMQPIRKEGICWNEKSPRRVKIPKLWKKSLSLDLMKTEHKIRGLPTESFWLKGLVTTWQKISQRHHVELF